MPYNNAINTGSEKRRSFVAPLFTAGYGERWASIEQSTDLAMQTSQDIWSQWLLNRRFGGAPQRMQTVLDYLHAVRDKVLSNANLAEGETLLDVGCGDGLIAFGTLEKVKSSKVIFSDISQDLLNVPLHMFWGYDVTPVMEIAQKIKAVYQRLQPLDTDPMLDFDERDLIAFAERAGFKEIHLELQAEVKPSTEGNWETFLRIAGNPKIPTIGEAMQQALTPDEAEKFIAYLRPLVEGKQASFEFRVGKLGG